MAKVHRNSQRGLSGGAIYKSVLERGTNLELNMDSENIFEKKRYKLYLYRK